MNSTFTQKKISDSYLSDISFFRIFMNVYFLMAVRITIPLSLLIFIR